MQKSDPEYKLLDRVIAVVDKIAETDAKELSNQYSLIFSTDKKVNYDAMTLIEKLKG
jgi:hypothetical protein